MEACCGIPPSPSSPLNKRQTKSRGGSTGRTEKASKSYKSRKLALLFKSIPYKIGSISQTKISQRRFDRDPQSVTFPAAK